MNHIRRWRAAAAVAPSLAVLLTSTLTRADTVPTVAPPLPPQPGTAAAPCTAAATAPDSWALVTQGGGNQRQLQLSVDAASPCRMYRALDTDSVQRSTDSGRTWQTVFRDAGTQAVPPSAACTPSTPLPSLAPLPSLTPVPTACPLNPVNPAFHLTSVLVPRNGDVLLGEDSNGDAVVRSDDSGATWSLSDGGTPGLAGLRVEALAVAPENPDIVYAVSVVRNNSGGTDTARAVFRSGDGGRTWTPARPLPPESNVAVTPGYIMQVDPVDPSHLWLVVSPDRAVVTPNSGWTLYESVDGGDTWTSMSTGPNSRAAQLLATVGPHGRTRLFLNASFGSATQVGCGTNTNCNPDAIFVSDDGAAWTQSTLPAVSANGLAWLAADPHRPGRMLYAGNFDGTPRLRVLVSDDWFDTTMRVGSLPATVWLGNYTPLPAMATTGDLIQVDALGRFYLPVYDRPVTNDGPATRAQYWLYTPPGSVVGGNGSVVSLPPPAVPGTCTGSTPCDIQQPCTDVVPCNAPPPPPPPCTTCPPGGSTVPLRASCPTDATVDPGHYVSPAYSGADTFGTLALVNRDMVFSRSDYVTNTTAYHAWLSHMTLNRDGTCTPEPDIDVAFSPDELNDPRIVWTTPSRSGNQGKGDPTHPVIDELTWDTTRDVLWVALDYAGCTSLTSQYNAPACPQSPPMPLFEVRLQPGNTAVAQLGWFAPNTDRCSSYRDDATLLSYDAVDDSLWVCTGEMSLATGAVTATCVDALVGNVLNGNAAWVWTYPDRLWLENEDDRTMYSIDSPRSACTDGPTVVHSYLGEPAAENEQFVCDPLTFGTPVMWMRNALARTFDAFPLPAGSCPTLPHRPDGSPSSTLDGVLVSPTVQPPLTPPASQLGAGNAGASQAQGQVETTTATQGQVQSQAQAEAQAQAQAQSQSQAQGQTSTVAQVQPGVMLQRRTQDQVATQVAGIGNSQTFLAKRRTAPSSGMAVQLVAAGIALGLGFAARRRPAFARRRRR